MYITDAILYSLFCLVVVFAILFITDLLIKFIKNISDRLNIEEHDGSEDTSLTSSQQPDPPYNHHIPAAPPQNLQPSDNQLTFTKPADIKSAKLISAADNNDNAPPPASKPRRIPIGTSDSPSLGGAESDREGIDGNLDFSSGELKLYDVEDHIAAMIMAIISNESGIPLYELRFKSIKLLSKKEIIL